jgi:hypothetical protein
LVSASMVACTGPLNTLQHAPQLFLAHASQLPTSRLSTHSCTLLSTPLLAHSHPCTCISALPSTCIPGIPCKHFSALAHTDRSSCTHNKYVLSANGSMQVSDPLNSCLSRLIEQKVGVSSSFRVLILSTPPNPVLSCPFLVHFCDKYPRRRLCRPAVRSPR